MALDAQIRDEYPPEIYMHIGPGRHLLMIETVQALGQFILIPRMQDYYGDCKYGVDEMPSLLRELQRLRHELEFNFFALQQLERIRAEVTDRTKEPFYVTAQDVSRLVRRLEKLCEIAIEDGKSIELLAD